VSELTSAPVPPLGPDDHLAGEGPEAILYVDLGCAHCAAAWRTIRALRLRLCFRHFPMAAKHPRAPALHAAAEAAARQGAFWELVDSLFADRGHVDDPHLWERARRLGLELERFNRDRRAEAVQARIRADFESGVRAGVVGTPTAHADGRLIAVAVERELAALADRSGEPERSSGPPLT
jgi:protein-disulfide isomerase